MVYLNLGMEKQESHYFLNTKCFVIGMEAIALYPREPKVQPHLKLRLKWKNK